MSNDVTRAIEKVRDLNIGGAVVIADALEALVEGGSDYLETTIEALRKLGVHDTIDKLDDQLHELRERVGIWVDAHAGLTAELEKLRYRAALADHAKATEFRELRERVDRLEHIEFQESGPTCHLCGSDDLGVLVRIDEDDDIWKCNGNCAHPQHALKSAPVADKEAGETRGTDENMWKKRADEVQPRCRTCSKLIVGAPFLLGGFCYCDERCVAAYIPAWVALHFKVCTYDKALPASDIGPWKDMYLCWDDRSKKLQFGVRLSHDPPSPPGIYWLRPRTARIDVERLAQALTAERWTHGGLFTPQRLITDLHDALAEQGIYDNTTHKGGE